MGDRRTPAVAAWWSAGWCVVVGGAWLVRAALGQDRLLLLPGGAWLLGALLLVCGCLPPLTLRPETPRRPLLVALWGAVGLIGVGGFGLVMSLVELSSSGRVTDAHGRPDWDGLAWRMVFAAGAVLLLRVTIAWQRRSRGVCERCGRGHSPYPRPVVERPPRSAAPRRLRRLALLASTGMAGYAVAKTAMALGLQIGGISGVDLETSGPTAWLEKHGVDVTAVFALLGVVLLMGLVHRWGMRLPRWLLLVPAWLGASTLAPYGVLLAVVFVLDALGVGDPGGEHQTWVGIGALAFGGYGWSLLLAALSYQRRTRFRCRDGQARACTGSRVSASSAHVSSRWRSTREPEGRPLQIRVRSSVGEV